MTDVPISQTVSAAQLHDVVIPDGWTFEPYSKESRGLESYFVLCTSGVRYACTIDFDKRCIRTGYSTSGTPLDWKYDKKRGYHVTPKYVGRGWKQQLVDRAIAHLREVL